MTQPVTQPGMLIGTPAYLAPERISGCPATPATDLYALGVVAHQCLTGQVPFAGEPLAVALAHLDRGIPALPPSVPPAVAALVAELTRQDPAARPRSAWDVAVRAEHLRVILSGPEAPSPATAPGSARAGPCLAGLSRRGRPGCGWPGRAAALALAGPLAAGAGAGAAPAPAGRPAAVPRPDRPRGRAAPAARPGAEQASLPVRGALVLTGVASVGFISWTLATLPGSALRQAPVRGPARGHAERRAGRPAPAEPGRGHARRRSQRR